MPLINCEVNLILAWSKDCVITNSRGEGTFATTETKLYVPVVILSTKNNEKLLQQLKSIFRKTVNWNKYESSIKTFAQNRYLNYLINPSFQGVNRLFALSFGNENDTTSHSTCYLPKVEIKDNNVMIDGKMIAVDLSRQNELDADSKAIQQINFTANLDRAGNTTIFFIIEEAKETIFEFSQGTIKVL